MRILIVDDDEIGLELLRSALLCAGHEVRTAGHGREALDVLRQWACRLVITDWLMPVMDGLELCREIRNGDFGGYVYVILLTSRQEAQDVVAGLNAGADDFVSKPFNRGELLARVRAGERVLSLETRDAMIFAMAKLAESRDPETGEHLERMQQYTRLLARQLDQVDAFAGEIDDEFISLIHLTSPLHDIGKVGIPDRVLLKPGKLLPDEFAIMKTHTLMGAGALNAALMQHPRTPMIRMAHDIARFHHEKYDGSGYPDGLQGHDIPLAARIVALADVYDALTSKRCYKAAVPHAQTMEIIRQERGRHFDPVVADTFVRAEDLISRVRENLAHVESMAPSRYGELVRGPLPQSVPV